MYLRARGFSIKGAHSREDGKKAIPLGARRSLSRIYAGRA